MKNLMTVLFALALLLVVASTSVAQDVSPELDNVAKIAEKAIQEKMPGWTCTRIPPMQGSKDVVSEKCESGVQAVSIDIVRFASQEVAKSRMDYARQQLEMVDKVAQSQGRQSTDKIQEELTPLGDEGFIWQRGAATEIVFRKNNFTININDISKVEDPHLSKEFAQHIASALSVSP